MLKVLNPKRVKKANQWVVTWFEKGAHKTIQKQKWFSTKEEAEEGKREIIIENK